MFYCTLQRWGIETFLRLQCCWHSIPSPPLQGQDLHEWDVRSPAVLGAAHPSLAHSARCSAFTVQVQLLGQPISCGRPSGYVDPAQAQQAAVAAASALEAFQVHICLG